jgi:glutaconyl-CoA/methylmalonyl-CoA decarboxylase subunit gamma
MRQFIITVGGEKFEVDVVEVSKNVNQSSQSSTNVKQTTQAPSKTEMESKVPQPAGGVAIDSPMPGSIIRILVNPGEEVSRGQKLFVLEAMKMENEIGSPVAGKVSAVKVNAGDTVTEGQLVIMLN